MNEECEMIPSYEAPEKIITMIFKGFSPFTFSHQDEVFSRAIEFLSHVTDRLVLTHMDLYAFTNPELSVKPDGTFEIKVGIKKKSVTPPSRTVTTLKE